MYSVKEIFYSLQGEGAQSGRAAVFCRFTGCNLWNGLERDKASSSCPFCDTDFVGVDGQAGGKFSSADLLAEQLHSFWPDNADAKAKPYVVFTGGEPLLQLDNALIDKMHQLGFEVAVETNGSIQVPENIDWICVSPKTNMDLKVTSGNELKLLFPQQQLAPESFQQLKFDYFYLQAIDDQNASSNKQKTLQYCLAHPQWFYSLQLHKILSID
ncbi:MAG: 7-carboxy-7-deazaguanine synthase [Pseudomonadota bacterium]